MKTNLKSDDCVVGEVQDSFKLYLEKLIYPQLYSLNLILFIFLINHVMQQGPIGI